MLAAVHNHCNIVSLLKNKFGQEEPTQEEVVSYQCAIYVRMWLNTYVY